MVCIKKFATKHVVILATLAAVSISLGGCGKKKMLIYQTPQFYTSDLKTIAVLPFRNQSTATAQNPGEVIADKLIAALQANGTYRVPSSNQVKPLLDDKDFMLAMSGQDGSVDISKFTNVDAQALLGGSVTTYAITSVPRTEPTPIYAYDNNGKQYISHYIQKPFRRNEANVSISATLFNRKGRLIHTSGTITKQVVSDGSPPTMDPYRCLASAADLVVQEVIAQLCVVHRQIEIKPKDVLKTATGFYDNRWDEEKKFSTLDDEMIVVISLPRSCDRNTFSIAIVKKDTRIDLAREIFSWDSSEAYKTFTFSPKDLASKGMGAGKYQIKFYSGPQLIFDHGFTIKEPK